MISYRISDADLWTRIDAQKATWKVRATAATAACLAAGRYVKKNAAGVKIDGLWSEIKEVFMVLQHDKCCYCERKLASMKYGKVEHDVEHYRPKSRVKNWFTVAVKKELSDWPATLGQNGAQSKGYFRLPFDPRNYATTCKECNTGLKRDYFPCGNQSLVDAPSPAGAAAEEPYLVFPIGDLDEDTESLIQFRGILAEPVFTAQADARRHWRARVTIRFFQLNVPESSLPEIERENLYRERAEVISSLADCLEALETTTSIVIRKQRETKIKRLIAASSSHTNCARSFLRLWMDPATRQEAMRIWQDVEIYLGPGSE